jgi:NMD protein affecting ribosome stability and mRNA decay
MKRECKSCGFHIVDPRAHGLCFDCWCDELEAHELALVPRDEEPDRS